VDIRDIIDLGDYLYGDFRVIVAHYRKIIDPATTPETKRVAKESIDRRMDSLRITLERLVDSDTNPLTEEDLAEAFAEIIEDLRHMDSKIVTKLAIPRVVNSMIELSDHLFP